MYREQFDLEMTEFYGSVEMGIMAHETPERNGLKLCEDLTYFEFLDENDKPVAPGIPGRVVVTDLTGTVMPSIRYDQGDYVVFEYVKNESGNIIRRLTEIKGRDDDFAVLPSGKRISFHYFYGLMEGDSRIRMFQVIQQQKDLFEIIIASDTQYFTQIHDELLIKLRQNVSPDVRYKIQRVDRILPDKSGKIRMMISNVDESSLIQ